MNPTIQDLLLGHGRELQATLGLEPSTARIEIQCLLQSALQVDRAYLFAHADEAPDATHVAVYRAMLQRRLQGEPIAYILGKREFYGLDLKVTPATLIPRPDTELLVELALQRIPMQAPCAVLDLGTGSGAIALSIAHARPAACVLAVDASAAALQVARDNRLTLDVRNVELRQSDWFLALNEMRFDVIVSNPPYIRAADEHLSQGDVRFEPLSALASGEDGLQDIRHICARAGQHLSPGGHLLLEHGYDQAGAVREIMRAAGFADVMSEKDLSGIERVTLGHA